MIHEIKNRRKSPRFKPYEMFITVEGFGNNHSLTCPVFDVTSCGASFCSPEYIWPGTHILIRFFTKSGDKEHIAEGCVKRAVSCPLEKKCYQIGIEITKHRGNNLDWFRQIVSQNTERNTNCPFGDEKTPVNCLKQIVQINTSK